MRSIPRISDFEDGAVVPHSVLPAPFIVAMAGTALLGLWAQLLVYERSVFTFFRETGLTLPKTILGFK